MICLIFFSHFDISPPQRPCRPPGQSFRTWPWYHERLPGAISSGLASSGSIAASQQLHQLHQLMAWFDMNWLAKIDTNTGSFDNGEVCIHNGAHIDSQVISFKHQRETTPHYNLNVKPCQRRQRLCLLNVSNTVLGSRFKPYGSRNIWGFWQQRHWIQWIGFPSNLSSNLSGVTNGDSGCFTTCRMPTFFVSGEPH